MQNGYDHSEEGLEMVPDESVAAFNAHQASLPKPRTMSPVDYSHMIAVIASWRDILNARLLALLALTGSLIGFGFVIYDPTTLRLWGLAIYAILCQAPILALYLRKG